MREKGRRREGKKLGSSHRWSARHRLSTVDWRGQLDFVTYIHINDWRTGHRYNYITDKEFTHSVTIAVFSIGAAAIGIGQLLAELIMR